MRLGRALIVALAVYLGADFLDPSIPGIFFLDNDQLFLDSVVHTKDEVPARLPSHPLPPAVDAGQSEEPPSIARSVPIPSPHRTHAGRSHTRGEPSAPPSAPEDH